MSWFESQLHQRLQNDSEELSDTVIELAQTVVEAKNLHLTNEDRISEIAINEMLSSFRKKPVKYPFNIRSFEEKLSYAAENYGIMYREVTLTYGWYKDAFGVMIATLKRDKTPVALIPVGISGYKYYDSRNRKYVRVTPKNGDMFEKKALVFYKPLPEGKVSFSKLLKYMVSYVSIPELFTWLALTLFSIALAFMVPDITWSLFSDEMNYNDRVLVLSIGLLILTATVAAHIFRQGQLLVTRRFITRLNTGVQTATMMRVLSLPMSFFRTYSAGDLASRLDTIEYLCEMLVTSVGSTVVFTLYAVMNIIHWRNRSLPFRVNLIITIVIVVVFILTLRRQSGFNVRRIEADTEVNGITYEIITGIQKIKLTGTEKRFFSRWGKQYTESARLNYSPPEMLVLLKTLPVIITFAELIFLFWAMNFCFEYYEDGVADFLSHSVWLSIFLGSVTSWFSGIQVMAMIKPIVNLLMPVYETDTEGEEGKVSVANFREGIDFSGVSFRYDESSPYILKNFNLHINDGEYIAVVGKTGSGKSTIMRLLIGFEKPVKGSIFINGVDIDNIDHKSLRKHIGIVQQDARLFRGDILSNIKLAAPNATWKDVWKAAEKAGIDEEIRKMPMGMHTIISEGGAGISGGQRQRIVIARAIITNPKILLLDEATSALDNVTQKKVATALDSLKCTRIVIAHRLSTIKQCDRIIVLQDGAIAESGTYEELIAKDGYFAELVAKQQLE